MFFESNVIQTSGCRSVVLLFQQLDKFIRETRHFNVQKLVTFRMFYSKFECKKWLKIGKTPQKAGFNHLGLVDKNATPNKNQLKVFWLFVMPTISQILCIRLIELEICNTL